MNERKNATACDRRRFFSRGHTDKAVKQRMREQRIYFFRSTIVRQQRKNEEQKEMKTDEKWK